MKQIHIRMTETLNEQLRALATENNRSLNAQIVFMLEQKLKSMADYEAYRTGSLDPRD